MTTETTPYQCICEYCGTKHMSNEWHGCDAMITASMNRQESYYRESRIRNGGTVDTSWTGD